MTNTEKLAVLDAYEARAYALLTDTDPTKADADWLLRGLETAARLGDGLRYRMDRDVPESPEAKENPDGPPRASAPTEAPETKPEPAKTEEPALTKAQVIAELTALANDHGVDIAAVMKDMGFTKLSDIPATRYAELLEKAKEAV